MRKLAVAILVLTTSVFAQDEKKVKTVTTKDGLITIPRLAEGAWEPKEQAASGASLIKLRSTVDGEFYFLMAKEYTVKAEDVASAEKLSKEIYKGSHEKFFKKVTYKRNEKVTWQGHEGWEAELDAVHEKMGDIHKVERVFVDGTHVFVVSGEGRPKDCETHEKDRKTFFDEVVWKSLPAKK
jgi:hypothetical protein